LTIFYKNLERGGRYVLFTVYFYSGNVSSEKLNEMLAVIESHKGNVRPDRIFSFEEVPEAHRWLEARNGHGKAVVLL
jgi:NADPH2:quinone reductase